MISIEWADESCRYRQVPFRRVFSQIKRPVPPDAEIVTAYTDGTVTFRTNKRMGGYHEAADLSGYQGVVVGDFVVHGLDILRGSVGVADSSGAITSVCTVCIPRVEADPRYFAYVMRSQASSGLPRALAKGIRSGGADFRRWETLADLPLPYPPLDEQRRIADFLDTETARIDALIEAKRTHAKLLGERQMASITQLATRGVGYSGPLRDSGDPWIGAVPEHWDVQKLMWLVDIAEGQVDPIKDPYFSMPLVAPNHIASGIGIVTGVSSAGDQGAISGKYLCHKGDVIYSKIRPALRKAALADVDCLCSADMYPMRATSSVLPEYLLWWLLAEPFSTWAVLESERVAMPKVNRESLANVRMALPPLDEQARIASAISDDVATVQSVVASMEEQLDLLTEYRQALITAAVTGQLDEMRLNGSRPVDDDIRVEVSG